jgi:hypothetical protein
MPGISPPNGRNCESWVSTSRPSLKHGESLPKPAKTSQKTNKIEKRPKAANLKCRAARGSSNNLEPPARQSSP